MANEDQNEQVNDVATEKTPAAEIHRPRPVLFTSTYNHTMDAKGRMVIPGEFRELLGETFYVCPSPDFDAIAIYTEEKWNERNDFYLFASEHSAMFDDEIGRFYGMSYKMHEFDSQGRILFPAVLRQRYLGEEHDITVVGAQHYIKVMTSAMDALSWNNFRTKLDDARKAELTRLKELLATKKENENGGMKHD